MFWKIVKVIGKVAETLFVIPAFLIGLQQIWKKKKTP